MHNNFATTPLPQLPWTPPAELETPTIQAAAPPVIPDLVSDFVLPEDFDIQIELKPLPAKMPENKISVTLSTPKIVYNITFYFNINLNIHIFIINYPGGPQVGVEVWWQNYCA